MTDDLQGLIVRAINSPLKLELVAFFHRNRYTMDYTEGIAHRIGADPQRVETALRELAAEGVVHQRQSTFNSSRPPVFSYTRDDGLHRLVEELVQQSQTNEGKQALLAVLKPSFLSSPAGSSASQKK